MTNKVPVARRTLVVRVRHHLERCGSRLVRRAGRAYVVSGAEATAYANLETLARSLGVLSEHEAVAS